VEVIDILPVLKALKDHEVDYVLVGGVAVNLHGILRATEDMDIFVKPDAENVDRLKQALQEVFRDGCIDEISVQDLAGSYPTIRYGPPDSDFVIDIIARLGEAVAFEDLDFEWITVEGVRIRVATPRTLIRMKRDTVRPLDRDDALRLAHAFHLEIDD
jgi:hypothetical protein